MKYFVEVLRDAISDEQAAATRLAETLKIDTNKALALLKRNPVTKPVSQPEAEKVAKLFRRAGIEVFVRSEPEADFKFEPTPTVSPSQPIEPVTPPSSTPETKPSSPSWPDVKMSSPTLPDAPEVKLSSPSWPDVKLSSPDLPNSHYSVPNVNLSSPNLLGTPVSDEALKIPSSFFGTTPTQDLPNQETLPPFESKYPTLPPISDPREVKPSTRSDSVGKFLLTAFLPGFLALAGVAVALYLMALPFMRNQQNASVQNAASTLASSISGWMDDVALSNPTLQQQLQATINRTQPPLRQQGVDFALLSDAEGNQLAGWYQDLPTPGVPDNFTNAILPDIKRTITEAATPNLSHQQQVIIDGSLFNIATHPIRQQDNAVGVVTVGIKDQTLTERIKQPALRTLLSGVAPLLLSGLLLSLIFGRKRS